MFKSMTAYGRASSHSSIGRFVVEIQSVNRKHLEINSFIPKELVRYDAEIKKWIAASVGRGQVNVKVSVFFDKNAPFVMTPNLPLARQIKAGWEVVSNDLDIPLDPAALLRILAQEKELMIYDEREGDEQQYREALQQAVSLALQQLMVMKEREGKLLYADITSRFVKIKDAIKQVAVKAPGATARYRDRLIERIKEVAAAGPELDERILREVGIYAEKIDIAEELTRFDAHLQQVQLLLETHVEGGIGKTLEFLLQELNREINTISSKSSDVDVAHLVIEIKSELERIREQIQNIE